jgi:hypothetical protein
MQLPLNICAKQMLCEMSKRRKQRSYRGSNDEKYNKCEEAAINRNAPYMNGIRRRGRRQNRLLPVAPDFEFKRKRRFKPAVFGDNHELVNNEK